VNIFPVEFISIVSINRDEKKRKIKQKKLTNNNNRIAENALKTLRTISTQQNNN
jgi:hypothetical protein